MALTVKTRGSLLGLVSAIGEVARRAGAPGTYDDASYWELKRDVMRAMADSYRDDGDDIRAEDCDRFAREADAHAARCNAKVLK